MRPVLLLAGALLPAALSSLTPAQVPSGWWVSAHHRDAASGPGAVAGLWLHHPTGAAPSVPVFGQGAQLTGAGAPPGTTIGAASVVLAEQTGSILYVGEVIPGGTAATLDLHRITLGGTGVASDTVVGSLGAFASGPVRISAISPTYVGSSPADEPTYYLMTLAGVPAGSPVLAIYTNQYGTLYTMPLAAGMPAGTATGVAFTSGYPDICIAVSTGPASSTIVAVPGSYGAPPPTGGTAVTVATLPASVTGMEYDQPSNTLYCSCEGGAAPLYAVNRATGAVTPIPAPAGPRGAVAFEPATGGLAVCGSPIGLPAGSMQRSDLAGGTALVSAPPVAGWGTPVSMDLRPDPRVLWAGPAMGLSTTWDPIWSGAATPVSNLPFAGNAGYGISFTVPFGLPYTGVLAFSLAEAPTPIPFGAPMMQMIRISLADLIALVPIGGVGAFAFPMPVPAGLSGFEIYVQAVVAIGLLPAALTDALAITVI